MTSKERRGSAMGVWVFATLLFLPLQACGQSAQNVPLDHDAYVKLVTGNYAELERVFGGHLTAYAAGRISDKELSWKFSLFHETSGLDAQFDEWIRLYPKSYAARLGRGLSRVGDAWRKRGSKFANETSDQQIREFKELLGKAASDLKASIDLYSKPVESYSRLIEISMALGLAAERGMLDTALTLDPKAYRPRRAYLAAITPKWGGSVEQLSAFIEECKKSALGPQEKAELEAQYFLYVAEYAHGQREFKVASDLYYKAYQLNKDPNALRWSGNEAKQGDFKDLAFERYNELARSHPKIEYGFTQRGYLHETHFKNDEKAFKDYLAASALGDSWAQNRVGWWYMTGRHVAKDFDKAESYFRKAAEQKEQKAIANLYTLRQLRQQTPGTK